MRTVSQLECVLVLQHSMAAVLTLSSGEIGEGYNHQIRIIVHSELRVCLKNGSVLYMGNQGQKRANFSSTYNTFSDKNVCTSITHKC